MNATSDPAVNGNGNGHEKIFTLNRPELDLNSLAPQLRNKVCCIGALTTGARMLYCYLSDQSFLKSVSQARGTVTMSKEKLGYAFGVAERTVRRWGRELEAIRVLWTRVYWHGGFELTTWYLRGLADEQQELWKDADPRYGRSRAAREHKRVTDRGVNGQFCPNTQGTVETTEKPQKSGVNGHECPVTSDNPVRRQRTAVSEGSGQSCPWSPDNPVRGLRTILSVVSGQSCPWPRDIPVRRHRTILSVVPGHQRPS